MFGSLAIWCEPVTRPAKGHGPKVELHFNMWKDLPSGDDVLDVGFRLEDVRTVRQLHFYVPATVPLETLEDLSHVLCDDKTLSAVFNETLRVGHITQSAFEAMQGEETYLTIMHVDFASHVELEMIKEADGTGTVITFKEALFRATESVGEQYFRIRVHLRGELRKLFTRDFAPLDRIFLSAFYRTDVVEFRVNEKRNFGEALKKRHPEMVMPVFRAIHYFLVRDIGTELVRSHAEIRKIRRLEPLLWTSYLKDLGGVLAEHMIIYHWREGGKHNDTVENFVALTWFRSVRRNVWSYLLVIPLLGGLGSALQALLTKAAVESGLFGDNLWTQLMILEILLILILLILALSQIWSGGRTDT